MITRQAAWDTGTDETELHVVAFYEDLTSGEWAKEIFHRIQNRVPREMGARPSLWRFEVLEVERFAALAAAAATEAAVLIVAARGTRPLPKRLLDCLENALMKTGRARVGLVAVLKQTDRIAKDSLPAYRQLQAASRKAKLRFFFLPCANLIPSRSVEDDFQFASTDVLDNSLFTKTGLHRAWGINE